MAERVGMSLDDIISKNKSSFSLRRGRGVGGGRSRGRGRGGRRGNSSSVSISTRGGNRGRGRSLRRGARGGRNSFGSNSTPRREGLTTQWNHDLYYGGANSFSPKSPSTGRTKLVVSNLYFGVSDSDIKELFAEFGTIRSSAVHYDKSGRSLGTAHIVFERRSDAMKAMNHYHNVDLDNRPMKISIEEERAPPVMVKSPLRTGRGANLKRLQKGPKPMSNGTSQRGIRRGKIGRGRGRGRVTSGGGRGRGQKKLPTAEELDAELEAYSVEASK